MLNTEFQQDISRIGAIEAVPKILEVVCKTTGMGFAAIARVTEDRWIACQVVDTIEFGLRPGDELKVETTICNEIRSSREPVVIDHVAEDKDFHGHLTPAMYGFQSYISMPIVLADGTFFGTLCAIDPRPARLRTAEIIGMFKLFAELIALHLDAYDKLTSAEARLQDEQRTSELREQFIAVLGHDLRNPLASIEAGIKMLMRETLSERQGKILTLMQGSARRMAGLIENVLDLARGRLGGGLPLDMENGRMLAPTLEQVLAEARTTWPDRKIEAHFDLPRPVRCDHARIAQLFSNLLGNALTHGDLNTPVKVSAALGDGTLVLSVSNAGEPISPAAIKHLFAPFHRGHLRPTLQGLGLGLYIASEIAKAHAGTLAVQSSNNETRFTFRMPAGQEAWKPDRVAPQNQGAGMP